MARSGPVHRGGESQHWPSGAPEPNARKWVNKKSVGVSSAVPRSNPAAVRHVSPCFHTCMSVFSSCALTAPACSLPLAGVSMSKWECLCVCQARVEGDLGPAPRDVCLVLGDTLWNHSSSFRRNASILSPLLQVPDLDADGTPELLVLTQEDKEVELSSRVTSVHVPRGLCLCSLVPFPFPGGIWVCSGDLPKALCSGTCRPNTLGQLCPCPQLMASPRLGVHSPLMPLSWVRL